MRSIIVVCLLFSVAVEINSQDVSGIASELFNNLLSSVISQWGNMSSEDMATLFDKFNQQGGALSHIWNAMDSHCSSHFDCGPEACCLQPTHSGKRAFTDGASLHTSSYCSPLKKLGQICSKHASGERVSKYSCPCEKDLECIATSSFQIHPLIVIDKEPFCKPARKPTH